MLRARALALIFSGLLFAGCLTPEEPTPGDKVEKGNLASPTPASNAAQTAEEKARQANITAGQRWHFHNYWGLSPTITLFDGNVSLQWTPNAGYPPARLTVGAVDIALPRGRIVPPETGRLDVNVSWVDTVVPQKLNLSYRHSAASGFVPHGIVANRETAAIAVSEDMADPPHRAESAWAFRLSAEAIAQGLGAANGTIRVKIVATIGRPIFIDPPHPDRWNGAVTIPIANASGGDSVALRGSTNHLVLEPATQRGGNSPTIATVAPPNGTVVPEDANVVLVRLRWQSSAPSSPLKLALAYHERNGGTGGAVEPATDGDTERVYRIPVDARSADPAYATTSGWSFEVVVEGEAGAFQGSWSLSAWASRLSIDSAEIPANPS